jgi:uncharacterized protein (TIGR02246 family)
MGRSSRIAPVITAAILLAGCAQAPPPPPPDTRAADEKIIRDGEAVWSADWGSRDIEKVLNHYADDATLMVPNMALIKGKEAMRGALKEMFADPNTSLNLTPQAAEVSKSGDLAYTQGTYTLTTTDEKTKKPIREIGKYLTVYRKQADGSWKAVEDINNPDAPAGPIK